jgi:hypothetical protein
LGLDIYRWTVFLIGDTMTVTVPAAAHVNGHEGARWRSDLELHNPHDDPVVCAIDLLERDTWNLRPQSRTATVEGSGSVRLVDVVASAFGTEGAGALRITPNESTILVSSRIYDDADDGSYGQHVPGFRASDAVWNFEAGRIIGLAHSPNPSAGFRTNIGLVSDCARSMEVEVELFDGDGEHLGTASSRLWSFGVRQLNHIFRPFTDDVVTNGHAIVRTLTPQCSFYAYASVVDNRTNDPLLIPATHE